MTQPILRPATPADAPAWDAFLAAHPAGLLYQSSRYRALLADLLEAEDTALVTTDATGAITGVLAWQAKSHAGRTVLNALPYYGSNGAPLTDHPAALALLVDAWHDASAPDRCSAATLVPNPFAPLQPDAPRATHQDDRIAQFTPLTPTDADPEALLARFDPAARRNVRKAQREGVTVHQDPDALGFLEQVHRDNMTAIGGLPKSPRFFQLLPRHCRAGQDYHVWVARDTAGTPLAALLAFPFGQAVEYFTPAVVEETRTLQALPAIVAHAMGYYAAAGLARWNWGATWPTQDGVYRFKKKFAAEELPYRYAVQVHDPALLRETRAALLDAFPGFYVLPFAALAPAGQETAP